MRRALFLIVLLCISAALPVTARCQSSYDLFGSARADALANSTTADESAIGLHANPAARAATDASTALFYARESFGLSVLRYGASHLVVPHGWGSIATGASTFGFEDYREIHVSAGYARRVALGTTRHVDLGLAARLYHTSIAGYGRATALALNAGLQVSILRSLRLGAHATNVNGTEFVTDEAVPRTLAIGLRYQALSSLTMLVDVFKDIRFPAAVRGGIEVHPVSALALRVGVTTAPVRFTAGAGIHLGPLDADVAVEQHQVLGWSPSASIAVQW